MSRRSLRFAIVGGGPAGLYAAEALATQRLNDSIVVFDRMPVPFGLLRYGVAPDHVAMRGLTATLERILEHPAVTFAGGVEIGIDLTVGDLRNCFDARVYSFGAGAGQKLAIDGQDLPICLSASSFASWYCGHPDVPAETIADLVKRARRVVVIGAGNVAVDAVRILAKSEQELAHTEMPAHVHNALARVREREIYLIARKGPEEAKFTTKELRELGQLDDANVEIRPSDLPVVDGHAAAVPKALGRNLEFLRSWANRTPPMRSKMIKFRFFERAIEIRNKNSNYTLVLESTRSGTPERTEIAVDLVLMAIGHQGAMIPGIVQHCAKTTLPTIAGRIIDGGEPVLGEYATGWIRRGPSGVIGTNKADALEVVGALVADVPMLLRRPPPTRDFLDLVRARSLTIFGAEHWRHVDQMERALGTRRGVARTTIHDRELLFSHMAPCGTNWN
jgi:ferredoxin/flavodoxin---NADP+ reductase